MTQRKIRLGAYPYLYTALMCICTRYTRYISFRCMYIQTHRVPISCLCYDYTIIVINGIYSHINPQLHTLVTQASYCGPGFIF